MCTPCISSCGLNWVDPQARSQQVISVRIVIDPITSTPGKMFATWYVEEEVNLTAAPQESGQDHIDIN